MRSLSARTALVLFFGASVLSCTEAPTSIHRSLKPQSVNAELTPNPNLTAPIVISQIYGGGGNSGAKLKNDFVELFNRSPFAINIDGWSVQYTSAAGSTWQTTALAGTIPPGAYYLVQEAAGANGTTDLPAPDASGSIAMSATDGKVALSSGSKALSGACPGAVDIVSYGSGNCGNAAPKLSNTTADFRLTSGCRYTRNPLADFQSPTAAPTPRNSQSATVQCPPPGPLDHLTIVGETSVTLGSPIQLAALAEDAQHQTVWSATITWSSTDENVVTVDPSGTVTGVQGSTTPIRINASAVDGTITQTATFQITVIVPEIHWIDVSTSADSFPPGFQAQLFATARVASGGTIVPATFTFEAVDPQIATIATVQNTGIITGIAPPADNTTKPGFRITATPIGGGTPYVFTAHTVSIQTAASAPPTIYATNDEFGDPTPASASNANDLLITRNQYTLSYNESHGTPNWVAYELDSRQIVPGQDRCNCFSADPSLPADKQILTSDYTNGGYDRGHMARSFDRTAANLDNASTFYLTNIVPQRADLNQGVWAKFENDLGDSARIGGRAVYIVTGPLYSRSHELTFIKNEGKVAIPDSTWKIALIGPRSGGNPFARADVQSWDDLAGLTILAVNMPNVAGVRNDPWTKYLTTVAKIEQATGYNFLSVLQTNFRTALEAGDHPPVAQYTLGGTPNEATPVTFDASLSSDADIGGPDFSEALTYSWQFSDGGKDTGRTVTHTFARFGSYTATLKLTDVFGWESTVTKPISVADVPPAVSALPDASLIAGERYSAIGTFADPGSDSWTASVDYGEGNGAGALKLDGNGFTLSHVYGSAGMFKLAVTVDDGGAHGSNTATVTVITPLAATQGLAQQVQSLAEGTSIVQVTPLLASINAAAKQIERGNVTPAINELDALINKMDAAVLSGRMSSDAAQQLTAMVRRIQRVLRT
jgi:DNA/RNA endonuclease G (NUC1)